MAYSTIYRVPARHGELGNSTTMSNTPPEINKLQLSSSFRMISSIRNYSGKNV